METSTPHRVLLVAHRTASTDGLLDAVRERAARGPTAFTLLVPRSAHGLHRVVNPEEQDESEARSVLARALPLLSAAAGSRVDGMVGDPSALSAIEDAVNRASYDEIVISTLPRALSRWLRLDLPSKAAALGIPVTTVTPADVAGVASAQ